MFFTVVNLTDKVCAYEINSNMMHAILIHFVLSATILVSNFGINPITGCQKQKHSSSFIN